MVLNAWSLFLNTRTLSAADLPLHTLLADLLFCLETIVLDDIDNAMKQSTAQTAVSSLANLLEILATTSQFRIAEGIQAELFHVVHRLYIANARYISGELPVLIQKQSRLLGRSATTLAGSGCVTLSLRLLFALFKRELHHGNLKHISPQTCVPCIDALVVQNDARPQVLLLLHGQYAYLWQVSYRHMNGWTSIASFGQN